MEDVAILELGIEDLPPRMVKSTLQQIQTLSKELLENQRIEFKKISLWGSSRRIILWIEGIKPRQKDMVEKEIGPPKNVVYDTKGKLTSAGKQYLKAKKAREEELGIEVTEKGEYVYIKRYTKGEKTIRVLPSLFQEIIKNIHFAKPMRWGKENFYFGRPLRYIFSMLGKDCIEFEIGGIKSGRKTRGHRYLFPRWIEVTSAQSYPEVIRKAKVILDPEERRKIILRSISKIISIIKRKGYPEAKLVEDEELLEELSYLVEYPTVLWGEFNVRYLSLPSFILEACLREYQKQFAISDGKKALPFFIGVRDGGKHNLEEIVEGNKRVIHARLNDAQFFYQEDKKLPLEKKVIGLKGITVQEKLGSYYDKTKRLVKLSEKISSELKVKKETIKKIKRAAYLCKADILTNMGREFPRLQGILGKEYALHSGEDPVVAQAIEEHKKPRFAGDSLPSSLEGAILAIVDKIDTLSGAFWIGFVPSGSEDPWGLRREAQGVVEIIIDKKIDISIEKLLSESMTLYGDDENARQKLGEFLTGRVLNLLRERGLTPDQVNALIKAGKDNFTDLFERAITLKYITSRKEFKQEGLAIIRLLNILKQAKEWGIKVTTEVKKEKLKEKEEINLYKKWEKIKKAVDGFFSKREYIKAYDKLSSLKEPIHIFFDKVLVMSKDPEVKLNRLSLLRDIGSRFLRIADFTKLQIK
ncbi:glycine--tRNA ligase subunit beta [Candidatus Aerophobetes bacterium]|nr:glycine--tRNA ligase subunit beta [Candidatus Aerophobetes bacterium]